MDRALGAKHHVVVSVERWPARPRWTVGRVLKIAFVVLALSGTGYLLHATSACQPGVRCAD